MKTPKVSTAGPENKVDGLYTAPTPGRIKDVNMAAIKPSVPRPIETAGLNTKHLLKAPGGGFID